MTSQKQRQGRRQWRHDTRILTEERENDDDEVEDVPRLLEVVVTQAEQLEDALHGEDADEDEVDVLEALGELLVLTVVLQTHRDHVQDDDDHDADVELLVGGQLEERQLTRQLSVK